MPKLGCGPALSNIQHGQLDNDGNEELPEAKLCHSTEPFFRSLLGELDHKLASSSDALHFTSDC